MAALGSATAMGLAIAFFGVGVGGGGGSTAPVPPSVYVTDRGDVQFFSLMADTGASAASAYAILDSGGTYQWDSNKGTAAGTKVEAVTGFPMSNALAIYYTGQNEGVRLDTASTGGKLDTIPVGATRYYRWYTRKLAPPQAAFDSLIDASIHPIQDGPGGTPAGNINWEFEMLTDLGGRWFPTMTPLNIPSSYTHQLCTTCSGTAPPSTVTYAGTIRLGDTLYVDSTYMFELSVNRFHADSATYKAKLWIVRGGSNHVLIGDTVDWFRRNVTPMRMDTMKYVFSSNVANTGLQFGSNGWSASAADSLTFLHHYFAGLAVCDSTWCGPYPIAGVEN